MYLTQKKSMRNGKHSSKLLGLSSILSVAVFLSACGSVTQGLTPSGMPSVTGSIKKRSPHLAGKKRMTPKLKKAIAYWGNKHKKDPKNSEYALNYAKNLKFAGQEQGAIKVLTSARFLHQENKAVAGELGRLLLKYGQNERAEGLLTSALDRAKPDWKVLSGLGTIHAQKGDNKQARSYFGQALSIVPNKPSILVNIATTYMLEDKPAEAENYLRRAYAIKPTRRTQRKLKQVLSAQGKGFNSRSLIQKAATASQAMSSRNAATRVYDVPQTTASTNFGAKRDLRPLDITKK